jgi:hypothetical protein
MSAGLRHQHKFGSRAAPKSSAPSGRAARSCTCPAARAGGGRAFSQRGARAHVRLPGAREGPARGVLPGATWRRRSRSSRASAMDCSRARISPRSRRASRRRCRLRFGDTELFKCGFWSQGPAELQTIALMWPRRSEGDAARQRRLLPPADRGDEARLRRPRAVLRRSGSWPMGARRGAAYPRTTRVAAIGLIDMRRSSRELRPGDARRNAALLPADESASRPRTGARARCTSMPWTRRATWPPLRRAGRGSSRPR